MSILRRLYFEKKFLLSSKIYFKAVRSVTKLGIMFRQMISRWELQNCVTSYRTLKEAARKKIVATEQKLLFQMKKKKKSQKLRTLRK